MPQKTDYTAQNSFTLVRPNNSVVIFEVNVDPDRPSLSRLRLPEGSTWTPDPHWHERYTEIFRVVQGRALLKLNGEKKVITPDDGPQVVDKFVVHEFMRADVEQEEKDSGEVVVEEWTDPADGMKQVFFRNLIGVIQDADSYWKGWVPLQAIFMMSRYDNFNVILPGRLSYLTTHTIFGVSALVARLAGLKWWYEEYTPAPLQAIAARQ